MKQIILAIAFAVAATPVAAQQAPAPASADTARAQLEGRIRERFARVVKERVGLNDDQMKRLRDVQTKYDQQRRPLALEERSARLQLRGIVINEQSADQKQVDVLLSRLIDIQKRRVQMLESEQRDLSAFMTPVQRAKFMGIREQLRKRVEAMRDGGAARGAGRPGAMRPGAMRPGVRRPRPGARRLP
ncbi:MAG TPA: Spy/CpxP family protein refolding chaperone [Gemmatimonadaceae bacterium]|nr:Spy/CpxP family protein refolding chaperone [Gemmatimonadaceae bacterium]